MSIYRVFIAAAILVSVVFLIVVGALRLSSRQVADSVSSTRQALESVHTGQELETALLRYNRLGNMYVASGDPEYLSLRNEAGGQVENALREAKLFLHGEAEEHLLASVEAEIAEYFEQRAEVEGRQVSLRELIIVVTPELNRSLQRIRDFKDLNRVQAREIGRASRELDQNANAITVFALGILLLSLGGVFYGLRKLLLAPLTEMYRRVAEMRLGGQDIALPTDVAPELRELSLAINQMTARLRQERKQQLTFVSGVAHDLRNPLTSIKGYLEFLTMRDAMPSESELRRQLSIVFNEAGRIEHMLEDLLDATRVEAGQFELVPEPTDLVVIGRSCVEAFALLSQKHRVRLIAPEHSVEVTADPQRIRQVLENLFSNAMKYSPLGGQITLSIVETGDAVALEVRDNGIGIPPEEQQIIFEPFRRSEASRQAFAGIGLGLSVSKRIVEAHGGRIEVESEPGVGACFRVILPKRPASGMENGAVATPRPRAA